MDVYVLDNQLRRTELVDYHETMIWTERFKDVGDFELHIPSTRGTRALFQEGTALGILASKRTMFVETKVDTSNSNGVAMLKITGRSMGKILADRVGAPNLLGSNATPKWSLTGTPTAIMREVFNKICVQKVNDLSDGIPFYTAGTLSTAGNIPEPADTVTVDLDIDSVLAIEKKFADMFDVGFRLVRDGDASKVYFEVYTGSDRTTLQSSLPAVVFAKELDNLSNTSSLSSVALQKTVAYVIGKFGSAVVYADGWAANTAVGYNRQVLLVKADDIDLPAGAPLQAALAQRGAEELAKNRAVVAFDGEIPESGSYLYGRDYNLGDLVEMRNSDGLTSQMLVTEQIFVSDAQGDRAYPTLATNRVITPGTWLAWDASQYWADATGYWNDLP